MKILKLSKFRSGLILLLASGVLAACGGGGGGGSVATPPPPLPPPPPPPPPAPITAVFSSIQDNVFSPTCATAGCHFGAGAQQGLRLDDANSYGLLVGVASMEVPAVQRVAVGDPANSYLIRKLEGTASIGAQMPFGGPALPQATINVIRQWITDGAMDDRPPSPKPIQVSSMSPLPYTTLDASPRSITAIFSRDPDASTINSNTFILVASGGDTTFGDGNEVSIAAASISVPAVNTATAVFDLTGISLADDTYRVRLLGSGASMILDMDANALNGEVSGDTSPADDTDGQDFQAEFVVAKPQANY